VFVPPLETPLRLADLSESPVPAGFDLGTPHVDLAPNLFARYEQTNLLRVVELGIGWSELFHEPVGPDLECMLWTNLPAVRGGTQPLASGQSLLAWATTTGTVHVADLGPSKRRWQWTSSLPSPNLQRFSPDGTLLAIAGTNHWIGNTLYWRKGVEIRSVTTGELLLKTDRILSEGSVQFAEDGNTLLAGSIHRGSWQMWRAPSWEVIHAAEAKDAASSAPGGAERADSQKP
jgi:hypothetical protein